MPVLFISQIFSAFFMTGLIWLVQLVHYPSFAAVDPKKFTEFHAFHSSRITWIVLPVMTLELGSALGLALFSTESAIWWINFASVLAIWALTGLVSVPLHNKLMRGNDGSQNQESQNDSYVDRLVSTNWARTALWTLRSLFLLGVLWLSLTTAHLKSA